MLKTIVKISLLATVLTTKSVAAQQVQADADNGTKNWLTALAQCTPGVSLDDCAQAFQGTSTTPKRLDHRQAEHNLYLDLNGTFRLVAIEALQEANWRITSVKFIGDFKEKSERRRLLQWVRKTIPHAFLADSFNGCGYPNSGLAWRSSKAISEEIALAHDGTADPRAGTGKNLERYFLQHTNMPVALCFLLPQDAHGYLERSNAEGVMRGFIQSEFFAAKVTPKNPSK